ncbi:MAG: asparaginase domain-containing protein [Planctomycetota bacterium]|nr:asparaginase domain-containing protein [Planctomycetota bacterium]
MSVGREHPGTLEIALLSTGGTIEKTYDARQGKLHNEDSVLDHILADLVIENIKLRRVQVMAKDSLDMTEEDHQHIAAKAIEESKRCHGVVIVHGTDRLSITGEIIYAAGPTVSPIVLTGAMRPWIVRNSDAYQNITEALLAVQLLAPGVYVCMHSRVLEFPGIVKDRDGLRFIHSTEVSQTDSKCSVDS